MCTTSPVASTEQQPFGNGMTQLNTLGKKKTLGKGMYNHGDNDKDGNNKGNPPQDDEDDEEDKEEEEEEEPDVPPPCHKCHLPPQFDNEDIEGHNINHGVGAQQVDHDGNVDELDSFKKNGPGLQFFPELEHIEDDYYSQDIGRLGNDDIQLERESTGQYFFNQFNSETILEYI